MPILAVNQTLPAPSQAAGLAVPVRLSAAQQLEPAAQEATIATDPGPPRVVQVAQTLAPIGQVVRLLRRPYNGPAVPRPLGTPAQPRQG